MFFLCPFNYNYKIPIQNRSLYNLFINNNNNNQQYIIFGNYKTYIFKIYLIYFSANIYLYIYLNQNNIILKLYIYIEFNYY